MNRPPAFQFYPKDWLDFRVQRMSLAAQGAYLKILCFMWADSHDQCSIVDDDALISRALGTAAEQWLELRKEIQCDSDPIFETTTGHLLSTRLQHEAKRQRKYRKLQSQKGKHSAQRRWNRGITAVNPVYQPECNSSSSLNSIERKKERGNRNTELNGHAQCFDVFWTTYPKKEGKGPCRRWWKEHKPDDMLLGLMLAKIEQAKQTKKWQEENGRFIPMPLTWLNQERWDDEYAAAVKQKERLPL